MIHAWMHKTEPQQDLKTCNVHQLVEVSEEQLKEMQSRYKVLIAELLFTQFAAFEMFEKYMPQMTECCYAAEMATKSAVITVPVLKNMLSL